MKINAGLVYELRTERSWSQEELAIASGLNIRSIQRIEKEATISLQSKKALASAFNIDIHDLDYKEIPVMKQYEYKTIQMPFKFGLFKKGAPDIDSFLNKEAKEGWRLHQLLAPSTSSTGPAEDMLAILEREVVA